LKYILLALQCNETSNLLEYLLSGVKKWFSVNFPSEWFIYVSGKIKKHDLVWDFKI